MVHAATGDPKGYRQQVRSLSAANKLQRSAAAAHSARQARQPSGGGGGSTQQEADGQSILRLDSALDLRRWVFISHAGSRGGLALTKERFQLGNVSCSSCQSPAQHDVAAAPSQTKPTLLYGSQA
jgi:hypothetical protein